MNINKNVKKLTVICLIAVTLLSVASCASTPVLERQGLNLVDTSTNKVYATAPSAYQPVAYSKNDTFVDAKGHVYRTAATSDGVLSEGNQFLYDLTFGTLLYDTSVSLPTLTEFEADSVHFYYEDSVATLLSTDTDKDNVAETVKLCLSQTACSISSGGTLDSSYRMTLTSEKYPVIAYSLLYLEYVKDVLEYEDTDSLENYTYREGVSYTVDEKGGGGYTVTYNYGKYFLYDSDTGKCIPASFIHDTYNNE